MILFLLFLITPALGWSPLKGHYIRALEPRTPVSYSYVRTPFYYRTYPRAYYTRHPGQEPRSRSTSDSEVIEAASLPKEVSPIMAYSNDMATDGSYSFRYETADGISREETSIMKQSGDERIRTVRGSYSYPSPDGRIIRVNYIADEGGFRTQESVPVD